jgi:hypothetical protein
VKPRYIGERQRRPSETYNTWNLLVAVPAAVAPASKREDRVVAMG